jgi:hypothetical protein
LYTVWPPVTNTEVHIYLCKIIFTNKYLLNNVRIFYLFIHANTCIYFMCIIPLHVYLCFKGLPNNSRDGVIIIRTPTWLYYKGKTITINKYCIIILMKFESLHYVGDINTRKVQTYTINDKNGLTMKWAKWTHDQPLKYKTT